MVDDEDGIREVVTSILEVEGYQVVEACNGEEALAAVEREAPRAILLDMRMPVLDGWGFAAAYRQRPGPHAPIIVMTAAQNARAWGEEVQAQGVVPKPFEMLALLDAVERLAGPPG